MPVKVRIPTPLRSVTGDRTEVEAQGATVGDLLTDLDRRYPGIRARLYDEAGSLRRFVNLYVNDEDVRYLQGEQTPLNDGDELSIIPAIAGGAQEQAEMARRTVKLVFPEHLVKEPLTFRMAKRFDITPNIRRARVSETAGELVLELLGTEENLEQGIRFLEEEGVQVTRVEGDVLE